MSDTEVIIRVTEFAIRIYNVKMGRHTIKVYEGSGLTPELFWERVSKDFGIELLLDVYSHPEGMAAGAVVPALLEGATEINLVDLPGLHIGCYQPPNPFSLADLAPELLARCAEAMIPPIKSRELLLPRKVKAK